MSCWSSTKKKKKRSYNRESEACGTHTGGVLLFFSAASFLRLLHNAFDQPFDPPTFHRASDGEQHLLTTFSPTRALGRWGEAERGKWQGDKKKREQVGVIENFCQGPENKRSRGSFSGAPRGRLGLLRSVSSQRGARSGRLAAGSCSLLTLHSLIAKPTRLLQPS